MRVTLIGHASIVVETDNAVIWCDPWLSGKAFNDSWALFPEPDFEESWYDRIDHIWISHEHPDHFHIPTLRSLPDVFKPRERLLFQRNNSDKMPKAFQRLGFDNVELLAHREIVELTPGTRVYCHQVGAMDSALAVLSGGSVILNLNDCEADTRDCRLIRSDIGAVDVLFNQFSVAGYDGRADYEQRLPDLAEKILDNMVRNHRDMDAETTVPFASFIYFCTKDNAYINRYANKPADVHAAFQRARLSLDLLFPGESLEPGRPGATRDSLARFVDEYERFAAMPLYSAAQVELSDIEDAFRLRFQQLRSKYPKVLRLSLKALVVYIPDLEVKVRFSWSDGSFRAVDRTQPEDMVVMSQPLWLCFDKRFGIQTLGVSGRLTVKKNFSAWKRYRIVASLNNAEVYLTLTHLLSRRNRRWMRSRIRGGLGQLRYQLRRMK